MSALKILRQMKLEAIIKEYPNVPHHALPVVKYSDVSTNTLTRCIIDFLRLSGHQAERINTMGRPIDKRQQVTDVIGKTKTIGTMTWGKSTATKGSADISATVFGRSVKIEVKFGSDRQSPDQNIYQQTIEASGGIYLIARTFEGFYQDYQELLK